MENTKKSLKKRLKRLIKKLNNLKKSIKFRNNKHFRVLSWPRKKKLLELMIKNQENLRRETKKASVDSVRYQMEILLKINNQTPNKERQHCTSIKNLNNQETKMIQN